MEALRRRHLERRLATVQDGTEPWVQVDGRRLLNLSSNNYLGLARHPRVVEATVEAALAWGAGSGSSRLVAGTSDLHRALETRLAAFKGTETALLFSSGYTANLGVIPALVRPGDLVLGDELNHASLIDGCRLSRADYRTYRHRDVVDLEEHLVRWEGSPREGPRSAGERSSQWPSAPPTRRGRCLVVTDTVFSMDGDVAPLVEIASACDRHGALLMVDEAHATGCIGPGGRGLVAHLGLQPLGAAAKERATRGAAEKANLESARAELVEGRMVRQAHHERVFGHGPGSAFRGEDQEGRGDRSSERPQLPAALSPAVGTADLEGRVDVSMSTLSKAFGGMGAFVAGETALTDYLVNVARTFVFTTALPPTVVAGAMAALAVLGEEPQRLADLQRNAAALREGLADLGFDTLGSETHIVPVLVGSAAKALEMAAGLRDEGLFTVAIRPPTVPPGRSRIRASVMATHTTEEIERTVDAFGRVGRRLGLL